MRSMRWIKMLLLIALAGCEGRPAAEQRGAEAATQPAVVVASNYPLYFFTSEIAGGSPEIVLPRIEGDPANWRPEAADITRMQSASLLILNGAGYESWLDWVTLDDRNLVDTTAALNASLIPLARETVHQHGPEGEHSHSGWAFTTWLDPELAARQAREIEQALSRLHPENQARYARNLDELTTRLEALDHALREAFSSLQSQPLMFSHPVYQYLEARYGLDGASLHWEPDEEPGARAWIELRDTLRGHPAALMIWEDEPLEATAARLAEFGVQPLVFHTASNTPAQGDYFEVMRANIDRLLLQ